MVESASPHFLDAGAARGCLTYSVIHLLGGLTLPPGLKSNLNPEESAFIYSAQSSPRNVGVACLTRTSTRVSKQCRKLIRTHWVPDFTLTPNLPCPQFFPPLQKGVLSSLLPLAQNTGVQLTLLCSASTFQLSAIAVPATFRLGQAPWPPLHSPAPQPPA